VYAGVCGVGCIGIPDFGTRRYVEAALTLAGAEWMPADPVAGVDIRTAVAAWGTLTELLGPVPRPG
jgi:hypothetical protein